MLEDHDGNLWFGAPSGLARQDNGGNVRIFPRPKPQGVNTFSTLQINFIHEAPRWYACGSPPRKACCASTRRPEAFTEYTTREGLPDNVVQCILGDKSGNLWLSTNNGLSRFNPNDNTFVNFHESDGLQGEQFNRKACSVDASGIMYFGGLRGFNMFDPSRIPAKPEGAGRVVLTELRIRGKTVPVRPDSVLPRPVWELDELNLSHNDEEFSFEFAALNFSDQSRTRYRFKLENLESQWTEVDSRNRSARYTGVPPGNYRFRVQASTDGTDMERT